jgi:ankyrin repeat protein
VTKLLANRQDVVVDFKDKHGWTPLSWAIMAGHEAVAELLRGRSPPSPPSNLTK